MPPLTTAESIAATARALLEAEGVEGVSMRRVAEAVGITPMAIYRHYASREALLESVAEAGFVELAARAGAVCAGDDALSRIGALLESYLDYAFERPKLFEYMFSAARPGARRFPEDFSARRSPTANVLFDAVSEGVARGELRDDDPWEVALALWAHAHGLICLYQGGRFGLTPARFRALYRRSLRRLFDGLKA